VFQPAWNYKYPPMDLLIRPFIVDALRDNPHPGGAGSDLRSC
jgi:hypothetical protein